MIDVSTYYISIIILLLYMLIFYKSSKYMFFFKPSLSLNICLLSNYDIHVFISPKCTLNSY